jgi:hypothetical protein
LAGTAGAIALVCGALLWPYAVSLREYGFEKTADAGADLVSYLDSGAAGLLWRTPEAAATPAETAHFVGYVALLLALSGAAVGLRSRKLRTPAAVALATGATGLVLTLGPTLHVAGRDVGAAPYAWLHALIPLLRGMAGSERADVLVRLGTALLAGIAAARLLSRPTRALRPVALVALSLVLLLEQWTPLAGRDLRVPQGSELPRVYSWLAGREPGPVVELPLYPEPAKSRWAAYLYFSTYHWQPIPFGRTSFYPPSHDWAAWAVRDFPDERSLAVLDHLGLQTVVVHPLLWPEGERARRLRDLAAEPRLQVLEVFDDRLAERFAPLGLGQERIYRLRAVSAARPPLCVPDDEIPRDGWRLRATSLRDLERIRDGDVTTAWVTERPQGPGDQLRVRLAKPEPLAALTLAMTYPFGEFPRHLRLKLRDASGEVRSVVVQDGPRESVEALETLLVSPRSARRTIRIEPAAEEVRSLVLKLSDTESDAAWPAWSVPELRAYRACR